MEIHEAIELQSCPYCGGAAMLEEENGWCWYVMCMECGSQTASIEYKNAESRFGAAEKAAHLWNIGKVLRSANGD